MSELRGKFKTLDLPPKANTALLSTGLALYAKDVVDAFSKRMGAMDRTAVLASIIPIVSCEVQATAAEEKGKLDAVDTGLCNVGDGLLISGIGAIPGLAVHAFRAIRDLFVSSGLASEQEIQSKRDEQWKPHYQAMEKFLDSDGLKSAVEGYFKADMVGPPIRSDSSRGHVEGRCAEPDCGSHKLQGGHRKRDFDGAEGHSSQVYCGGAAEKSQLQGRLPDIVEESLRVQAEKFNHRFINAFREDASRNPYGDDKGKVESISKHLESHQLQIPPKTDIEARIRPISAELELPSIDFDENTSFRGSGEAPFRPFDKTASTPVKAPPARCQGNVGGDGWRTKGRRGFCPLRG